MLRVRESGLLLAILFSNIIECNSSLVFFRALSLTITRFYPRKMHRQNNVPAEREMTAGFKWDAVFFPRMRAKRLLSWRPLRTMAKDESNQIERKRPRSSDGIRTQLLRTLRRVNQPHITRRVKRCVSCVEYTHTHEHAETRTHLENRHASRGQPSANNCLNTSNTINTGKHARRWPCRANHI